MAVITTDADLRRNDSRDFYAAKDFRPRNLQAAVNIYIYIYIKATAAPDIELG